MSRPEQGSPWLSTVLPNYPALERDIEVDVLIVGAGLTGITTAYLMAEEGIRVALIDRARLADADTARTTAHLTYVTDERLHTLADKFGNEAARTFWQGGAAAIDTIEEINTQTGSKGDFARVTGYLHAPRDAALEGQIEQLHKDAKLAEAFGFDAQFMDLVPFAKTPGVMFADQARFHPRKYLRALLPIIEERNGLIFENTAFECVEDDRMTVRANGHRIRCDYLVIATHNPLMGKQGTLTATLFQTKLSLYTSYVLGARLPPNTVEQALFWDTADPYEYLRVDDRDDHQYAIFGGNDVKTGQEKNTESVFVGLEAKLRRIFPKAAITHRWMGQVVETDDGMPFIGENEEKEFIATGFCGNGFTLGTLSAMMARDRYLGRNNPWFSLFGVKRSPFHGGTWRYLRENADFPYYFVRDRLSAPQSHDLDSVRPGEGKIIAVNGKKTAAYRDLSGQLTLLSPTCTHLKCLVRWNRADQTWDCPCHGSRFHPTGNVLSGPAESPLQRLNAV